MFLVLETKQHKFSRLYSDQASTKFRIFFVVSRMRDGHILGAAVLTDMKTGGFVAAESVPIRPVAEPCLSNPGPMRISSNVTLHRFDIVLNAEQGFSLLLQHATGMPTAARSG